LIITIIDDKRCKDCHTSDILNAIKSKPDLKNVRYIIKDFSEESAKQILKDNEIKKLPVFIFSNNNINSLKNYLIKTKTNKYYLNV
jgi:hypothetical protein